MNSVMEPILESLPWARSIFLGNAVWAWAGAALTVLVVGIVARAAVWVASRGIERSFASGRAERLGGAMTLGRAFLESTRGWFLFLVSLAVARPWLQLGEDVSSVWTIVLTVGVSLQIALWLDRMFKNWLDRVIEERAKDDPAQLTSFSAVRFLGQLVLWSAVLLLSLDNLGVDVSALVAGLGIGGIAVALAAQSVLGDLFASLAIVLDRPFEVGDFVIVGDFLGVIEKIGLKTTRVRSLGGEQITFGNTDLLSSRIRNYKRMQERRVAFELDVVHGTPTASLREIPGIAREAIEAQENTRFDRAHMKAIQPTALRYEIVYYIGTNDYTAYMDVQQAINLQILEQLEERSVRLAHPTYTVHVGGESMDELVAVAGGERPGGADADTSGGADRAGSNGS